MTPPAAKRTHRSESASASLRDVGFAANFLGKGGGETAWPVRPPDLSRLLEFPALTVPVSLEHEPQPFQREMTVVVLDGVQIRQQ
jgi:hypothetical protein